MAPFGGFFYGKATGRYRLVGRPRQHLRPTDYDRLEAMASVGASMRTIAKRLGVAYVTFQKILQRDRRAEEAFEAGRGELESELVGVLYRQAVDPKNRNPTPALFLLKSMRNFSDQPQPALPENRVEITFQLPGALSEEQYKQLIDVTPKRQLAEAGVTDVG